MDSIFEGSIATDSTFVTKIISFPKKNPKNNLEQTKFLDYWMNTFLYFILVMMNLKVKLNTTTK